MTKNNLRRLIGTAAAALLASSCAVRHQAPTEAPISDKSQAAPVSEPAALPTGPVPPVAAKKPYQVPSPNGAREDDYYWLRDDSRQSAEMLDYLKKENLYRDAAMAATTPIDGRLGDATQDLAPFMVFMAGEGSRYITGQTLVVDGGRTMVR